MAAESCELPHPTSAPASRRRRACTENPGDRLSRSTLSPCPCRAEVLSVVTHGGTLQRPAGLSSSPKGARPKPTPGGGERETERDLVWWLRIPRRELGGPRSGCCQDRDLPAASCAESGAHLEPAPLAAPAPARVSLHTSPSRRRAEQGGPGLGQRRRRSHIARRAAARLGERGQGAPRPRRRRRQSGAPSTLSLRQSRLPPPPPGHLAPAPLCRALPLPQPQPGGLSLG